MESNKNQSADHSLDNSDVSKIFVPNPLENEKHDSASVEAVRTTFINSRDNSIQNTQKLNLQVTPNPQN